MTSRSCRHEGDRTVYWEGREAARGCAHAYVGAARVVTPLMLGAHTAYFRQMQSRGRKNCDVFIARIGMLQSERQNAENEASSHADMRIRVAQESVRYKKLEARVTN